MSITRNFTMRLWQNLVVNQCRFVGSQQSTTSCKVVRFKWSKSGRITHRMHQDAQAAGGRHWWTSAEQRSEQKQQAQSMDDVTWLNSKVRAEDVIDVFRFWGPGPQVIHGRFYARNKGMGGKKLKMRVHLKDGDDGGAWPLLIFLKRVVSFCLGPRQSAFSAARIHNQGNLEEQLREGLHVDNEPRKGGERGEDWGSWLRHLMAMCHKGESSGSFREPNHLSSGQCWFMIP